MGDPQVNAVDSGDKTKLDKVMKLVRLVGQTLIWIADGKRGLDGMIRLLQLVNDRPDFESVLDAPRPVPAVPTHQSNQPKVWKKFYREVFGLTVNFSAVKLADDPGGFGWVVFVAKGLTLNAVWAKCRERFLSYSYLGDDLDQVVPTNDRVAMESYAKRFRDRVEADEENRNLSANMLAGREIQGITLLERLLLELWYHWSMGKHLDIQCVTLCAGSRDQSGLVPRVRWRFSQLKVHYCRPGYYCDSLRARSAV